MNKITPEQVRNVLQKSASSFGYCLQSALKNAASDPSLKVMMGPPGREGDTAHFWNIDSSGNVIDTANNAVGKDYKYVGREVDAGSIMRELGKVNQ